MYLADLNPVRGHEQAGYRPVVVVQSDVINSVTSTVVIVPFTTNLRRALLPSCQLVRAGDGGLLQDSVALCHQLRVVDKSRLATRLGALSAQAMQGICEKLLFSLAL
jgi:mRNA interferase MazF